MPGSWVLNWVDTIWNKSRDSLKVASQYLQACWTPICKRQCSSVTIVDNALTGVLFRPSLHHKGI